MVEQRASYRNDRPKWDPREEDVRVNRPLPEHVPKVIRELKPHRMIIRPDYAMLTFTVPFYRMGLLGFRAGAAEFGTFEYIDGLWFWNGNDSTKPKA